MSLITVAIVGRPNIGKSTLFNTLSGQKKAITANESGTTRDCVYTKIYEPVPFLLVDTAGIELATQDRDIEKNIQKQIENAIEEADLILFGLDGRIPLMPEDREILTKLYKSNKKFFVFVNKVDNDTWEIEAEKVFQKFYKEMYYISALNKRGFDEFIDALFREVKHLQKNKKHSHTDSTGKICFVGKPNVGKSSLLNVFLNKNEAVVSQEAGTTRDSLERDIVFQGKNMTIIDTAGLRKRTKRERGIETFSALRTLKNIMHCDVCLLVIDATEEVSKQDMNISKIILDNQKSVILVVNKWDMVEKDENTLFEYEKYLRHIFGYMKWVPIIFTSALEKKRTYALLEIITQILEERKKTIPTSQFNKSIKKYILQKPPQARHKKIAHPKIYYGTQTQENPPEFTLFVNNTSFFHSSYRRYLQNCLYMDYTFLGTPIKIVYKNS